MDFKPEDIPRLKEQGSKSPKLTRMQKLMEAAHTTVDESMADWITARLDRLPDEKMGEVKQLADAVETLKSKISAAVYEAQRAFLKVPIIKELNITNEDFDDIRDSIFNTMETSGVVSDDFKSEIEAREKASSIVRQAYLK